LRQTHRIVPVDFDRQNSLDYGNENPPIRQEREERVYRNIPLKYVTGVADGREQPDYTLARKVLDKGMTYAHRGKNINQLPATDYEVTGPGLSYLEQGQQLTTAQLRDALADLGKDSFEYRKI
jgi:hypothetical protein